MNYELKLTDVILMLFVVYMIVSYVFKLGYDDSDNKKIRKKSGFMVYTDFGTGNQYISTIFDFTGHKPRLDESGKQINIYTNPIIKKD